MTDQGKHQQQYSYVPLHDTAGNDPAPAYVQYPPSAPSASSINSGKSGYGHYPEASYGNAAVYPTTYQTSLMKGGDVETGSGNTYDATDFTTFHPANSRHRFVLKIYTILFLQLLLTFGLTMIFVTNQAIKEFVQQSTAMLVTAIVLSFVFLIILACCGQIARIQPWNYILLFLFTLVEGYMVGVVSSFYETQSVMFALIITMVVVIGLSLFACQTKYDFTGMGPYLVGVLLVLICFGFLNMILCSAGTCQVLNTVYSLCGALVFSLFIVYDTQMIIGGKHKKYQFAEDEYVFAALNLYLDVVNLFLYILSLFKTNDE